MSVCLIEETEVGLVDKRCGLQCVARMFASHEAVSEPSQLVIYEWHQLIERRLIAIGPVKDQLGHLSCVGVVM